MCFGIFSFLFAFSFNHRTPLRKEEVDASYNGWGRRGRGRGRAFVKGPQDLSTLSTPLQL